MKHILPLLLLFVLFNTTSSFAQQKIYYELGKRYAGLQKEQIKINSKSYGNPKASFTYKAKVHMVTFDKDTNLYRVKEIIPRAEFPEYIIQELSCIEWPATIHETSVIKYYEKGVLTADKEYMIVFGEEGRWKQALVYRNGIRPQYMDNVELEEGGYEIVEIAGIAPGVCADQNWYGGSALAFADSLMKYLQFDNNSCINKFRGSSYNAVVKVNADGMIKETNIFGIPPYVLEQKLEEYCSSIRFPFQGIEAYCSWEYNISITLSPEGKVLVRPGRRY